MEMEKTITMRNPYIYRLSRLTQKTGRVPRDPRNPVAYKVIKSRVVNRVQDEDGDGIAILLTLAVPANVNVPDLKSQLRIDYDTFCQHEYDCCGRMYYSIFDPSMRRNKRREYRVLLTGHRNV